ncbi:MAG: hypothetical protein JW769_03960 [Parachlamydiales bacterium]|nr:hypothetical protein [Parachlamydiales bacterium]
MSSMSRPTVFESTSGRPQYIATSPGEPYSCDQETAQKIMEFMDLRFPDKYTYKYAEGKLSLVVKEHN